MLCVESYTKIPDYWIGSTPVYKIEKKKFATWFLIDFFSVIFGTSSSKHREYPAEISKISSRPTLLIFLEALQESTILELVY